MVLLRKVIGDVLRARRLAQHRTLREVSTAANVSLGYLSEIERGHKEASSELLASVCDALGAQLSEMLADVAAAVALTEQIEDLASTAAEPAVGPSGRPTSTLAHAAATDPVPARPSATHSEVTDGDITVRVTSEGPLKTLLTAKRAGPAAPDHRQSEPVFVG